MPKDKAKIIYDIMHGSNYRNLAAHFVYDAVQQHANRIASMSPSSFTNPLLEGPRWHALAKEIKEKLER